MNVHHLELFYYVARYKGISQAVRHIPYGIQQPAISSQLIQLEQDLKVSLFERRPFSLTLAGEELYEFIAPFFGNISTISDKIQGKLGQKLSIAASPTILQDYVPEIVAGMRRDFPAISLKCSEIAPGQAEEAVLLRDTDLVLSILTSKAPSGIKVCKMAEVPMILLVPSSSNYTSSKQLLSSITSDRILVSLPQHEILTKLFIQELRKRNLEWKPDIEVSSLAMIQKYVEQGFGIGLSVFRPGFCMPPHLRAIALPGFPKITVGALWRGQLRAVASSFLKRLQMRLADLK